MDSEQTAPTTGQMTTGQGAAQQVERVQAELLEHARRQTKALENINWVLMAFFVVSLLAAAVWLLGLTG